MKPLNCKGNVYMLENGAYNLEGILYAHFDGTQGKHGKKPKLLL